MSTLLLVLGAIALGAAVVCVVTLTMCWLKDKIAYLISVKKAKKVVVADIHKLVDECSNKVSYNDLNNLCKKGVNEVIIPLDSRDQVIGNVEMVKDRNKTLDQEVEAFLGREKMVVVEA